MDFGGSLGSSYYQCKTFLSGLDNLQWSIVEQPHFVSCGKELFADETLKFYETIDDCLKVQQPDVVLLSSVLQYLEKPYDLLESIIKHKFSYIIFDITPFHNGSHDIITIQQVPEVIYSADYPCWIFSLDKFMKFLDNEFKSLNFQALEKFSANYSGLFFKLKR